MRIIRLYLYLMLVLGVVAATRAPGVTEPEADKGIVTLDVGEKTYPAAVYEIVKKGPTQNGWQFAAVRARYGTRDEKTGLYTTHVDVSLDVPIRKPAAFTKIQLVDPREFWIPDRGEATLGMTLSSISKDLDGPYKAWTRRVSRDKFDPKGQRNEGSGSLTGVFYEGTGRAEGHFEAEVKRITEEFKPAERVLKISGSYSVKVPLAKN